MTVANVTVRVRDSAGHLSAPAILPVDLGPRPAIPVYASPALGTGTPPETTGLAEEYTQRRDAGWASGLMAYWPGAPSWTTQWATLASRWPHGFPLLASPKSTTGVAAFIGSAPLAWRPQVLVCYWQEPEDNHTTDTARAAYRAKVAEMASIVRPLGCRNGIHLQEWMLDPANTAPWGGAANLATFVADPVPASVDVVSWSLYTSWYGADWQSRLTRIRDFSTAFLPGVPWIVGAAGFPAHPTDPVPSTVRTTRANRVRAAADWLVANGGSGFGWFDVDSFADNGQDNLASKDPALADALRWVAQLQMPDAH